MNFEDYASAITETVDRREAATRLSAAMGALSDAMNTDDNDLLVNAVGNVFYALALVCHSCDIAPRTPNSNLVIGRSVKRLMMWKVLQETLPRVLSVCEAVIVQSQPVYDFGAFLFAFATYSGFDPLYILQDNADVWG